MQRLLAVCQLAAVVLVAGGCGANAVPTDEVAAAGETTKAAGTARVEVVSPFSVGFSNQNDEFRSTGIVDYARDRSEYRDEASGCRTITIGDVTYGETPFANVFAAGKRWVKSGGETIDSEALFLQSQGSTTGIMFLFKTPQPAPDEYLGYLRKTSGEPERLGQEDVRGVPTVHYRIKLDVRRLMRAELEAAGWQVANVERYLEGLQKEMSEIDLWVDSEGLVRRIVTNDASSSAEGAMSNAATTTEFFDFGVETDIQPPPEPEVIDEAELRRVADEKLREWRDAENSGEGSQPLPGAFDLSTLPGGDSGQISCPH